MMLAFTSHSKGKMHLGQESLSVGLASNNHRLPGGTSPRTSPNPLTVAGGDDRPGAGLFLPLTSLAGDQQHLRVELHFGQGKRSCCCCRSGGRFPRWASMPRGRPLKQPHTAGVCTPWSRDMGCPWCTIARGRQGDPNTVSLSDTHQR